MIVSLSIFISSLLGFNDSLNCKCPIKNGRILIDRNLTGEYGKIIPGVSIKGKSNVVIAAAGGIVSKVKTISPNYYIVFITNKEQVYSYDNLSKVTVTEGQYLAEGQSIGELHPNRSLFFHISGVTELKDYKLILQCKSKKVNNLTKC